MKRGPTPVDKTLCWINQQLVNQIHIMLQNIQKLGQRRFWLLRNISHLFCYLLDNSTKFWPDSVSFSPPFRGTSHSQDSNYRNHVILWATLMCITTGTVEYPQKWPTISWFKKIAREEQDEGPPGKMWEVQDQGPPGKR